MESFFSVLATFWFWLVAIETIVIFTCVARDSGTVAAVSLIIFGALLYWVADVDFISWFGDNPEYLYFGVPGYFIVGFLWSLTKWILFLFDKKSEFNKEKQNFLMAAGLPPNTSLTHKAVEEGSLAQETLTKWKERRYPATKRVPRVRDHKYDIMRWIGYWPFSLLWSLVDDFVKRISRAIYNLIHDIFQTIANKILSELE